jgi:hypothetical protein
LNTVSNMSNPHNHDTNGNNRNADISISMLLPFLFFILDSSLLFSSFASGLVGICAIHIASLSVNTQQFLLKQRKNINIAYDATNIDFNRLFQSINDISSQIYDCQQHNSVSSPLHTSELIAALRLASERVIFEDIEEDTDDNNNSTVNMVTDDEEEDDEDVDNINEETSNSENNSDTSSEEDNAFLISSSRESVDEEGTSVLNDENDEGEDGDGDGDGEEEEECISSESVKIETDSTSQSKIIVSMPIIVVDSASVPTLLNEEENKEEERVDKHYLHKSEVAF